jgi:hypothetical protein
LDQFACREKGTLSWNVLCWTNGSLPLGFSLSVGWRRISRKPSYRAVAVSPRVDSTVLRGMKCEDRQEGCMRRDRRNRHRWAMSAPAAEISKSALFLSPGQQIGLGPRIRLPARSDAPITSAKKFGTGGPETAGPVVTMRSDRAGGEALNAGHGRSIMRRFSLPAIAARSAPNSVAQISREIVP